MTASSARPARQYGSDEPSGWAGWVLFGGVIMMMVGTFQIIEGLTALFRHSYFTVGHNDLLVRVSYTGWGWIHIIIGAIVVGAGAGLLTGKTWARVVGILMASLSAFSNLIFIAAYPLWSVTVIILDVVVIYAIAVHGRELRP